MSDSPSQKGNHFKRGFIPAMALLFLLVAPLTGSAEIIYFDTDNCGLSSDYVKCSAIDNKGDKWVGTEVTGYGSLNHFGSDSLWFVFAPGVMPNNQITSMAFDTGGNLWIGTLTAGLYKYSSLSEWQSYAADSNISGVNISSLTVDKNNQIWIGTLGSGLLRFDGDSAWAKFTMADSLNDNRILAIFADKANRIWVGTYSGIDLLDSGWHYYDSLNSLLPGNAVRAFAEDRSGNIWIGTNAGAARVDQSGNWTVFDSLNSGLASNQISAITVDSSGNIWFGHRATSAQEIMVSEWRGGTSWQVINLDHVPLSLYVDITCAVTDHSGNIWFGTNGEGVAVIKVEPMAVSARNDPRPNRFYLGANYPNPFNPATSFEFSLPARSEVDITIFDILGRKVRTLLHDSRPAGSYIMRWEGRNDDGTPAPTGFYFYRLKTEREATTRKMLLLK
ncbi:hypothetical protein TRIP_C20109 [Candidatus Zixiibacteriota bacterium]|nr:hypothetical protein TRIP_C20109 [candidate division Zixibacteria bacterium]